ncbi:DUF2651 domain-containing protein [Jeotgalibacillus sp. S-D1]|uniref:DUF2651 family protein n=1 Tax=Jeotgalibacillus sp. S-D1 TaxID=2552189 RepID=UPI00105933CC|nr:DUF2651 family protein [Jeotgalibacillus sp. S-D1]TDL31929.1 DUF2651 domain-containing protein [Jeotgalibacillus sp. S-D1]
MEFLLILFLYPVIVMAASISGFLLFKKWFIMPIVTLIVFTFLTFAVFNKSFFIWVVVYTLLSLGVSLITKFLKK